MRSALEAAHTAHHRTFDAEAFGAAGTDRVESGRNGHAVAGSCVIPVRAWSEFRARTKSAGASQSGYFVMPKRSRPNAVIALPRRSL